MITDQMYHTFMCKCYSCSENLGKFFEVNKLNLNCDYFKIPAVSNIIKNQSLKRDAWTQLKLLKVKLDEF